MNVGTIANTDQLFETAYDELCRIARRLCGSTSTLDPASLVHDSYLRYRRRRFDSGREDERLRAFIFVMALAMRSVARDRRRRETALKRGGGTLPVAVENMDACRDESTATRTQETDHALHDVLHQLAEIHPKWLAAVAHHDLAGRSIRETARRMGIGEPTVRTYRRSALNWLRDALIADR
ncbi:MAG: sigma-70 family RNA polymerase sigma factor [Acidobacteriota bacterium]|nr:sigma-70 family RNA polymerase sigma factor [Acidobacteriota bacterium]MDH3785598.1 sigma-70 family RNA polymerase sigma factor [Acidobacteriota bacterium]